MAHFAQLDENNVVTRVIVVANPELLDESGKESEAKGVAFCKSLFGENTRWAQTSYNKTFRKNYAAEGMIFREDLDAFILPQPYPSWTLNLETARWVSPVPYPTDDKMYRWDEDTLSWVETGAWLPNG